MTFDESSLRSAFDAAALAMASADDALTQREILEIAVGGAARGREETFARIVSGQTE